MKIVEFFSGIGAQRAALDRISKEYGIPMEHVAQCDVDKYAVASYNALFGETPNLGDISKLERIPECDLASYSFPCTDLSKAGKQQGMEEGSGTHSSLLWEFARILRSTPEAERPEWLVMENVPAVHSKDTKKKKGNIHEFNRWIGILTELGYNSLWFDLNAKDCGVAQNRNRCFMISRRADKGPCPEKGPQPMQLNKVLRDYLEKDVEDKYYLSYTQVEHLLWHNEKNKVKNRGFDFKPRTADTIASTISTRAGQRQTDNFVMCEQVADLNREGWNDSADRVYGVNALCPTINTCQGGGHEVKIAVEGDRVPIVDGTKKGYAMAEEGDGLVLGFYTGKSTARGRVQKSKCPTLQTGINVAVLERDGDGKHFLIRKLTPRETWRLMGRTDEEFDKVKAIGTSDSQLYKQAGNSIVVDALTQVFRLMMETSGKRKLQRTLDDFNKEVEE